MDKFEETVVREREQQRAATSGKTGSGTGDDLLDIENPHPDLEEMRRKMIASRTRDAQALARERQQLQAEREQLSAMRQLFEQQGQRAPAAPAQSAKRFDYLPAHLQRAVETDPNLQDFVSSIESMVESRVGKANPANDELRSEIDELKSMLSQQEQRYKMDRYQQQAEPFRQKYGKHLDPDTLQRTAQTALQLGTDLESALALTDRGLYDRVLREHAFAAAKEEILRDHGAYLNGMDEKLGVDPQPNSNPVSKDGQMESMQDSLRHSVSRADFIAMQMPNGNA